MIKLLNYTQFKTDFLELIKKRGEIQFEELKSSVQNILDDIKREGDTALLKYEQKFDKIIFTREELRVSQALIEAAYSRINSETLEAIRQTINNVTTFHKAQKRDLWYIETRKGVSVGQIMRPIEKIGIYVPGGKASYPSTVIMTAVPAKIAGVQEIILCTPPKLDGSINPAVLVAANEAGVDKIFRIGGVQAIGAMAYGTETVPAVQKIVGPGNKYVNTAKLLVNSFVGIDLPAGPSEVLIIADETSDSQLIAIDILSQAEHDENTYCFLLTPSITLAKQVQKSITQYLPTQPRKSIIEKALNNCYLIQVDNLTQAIELCNEIAPEHLEIHMKDPETVLAQIFNAGAIFLGSYSPVPAGDYAAGSNHVLPTGGTAKIYSGLSLFSFVKLIDVVKCTPEGLKKLTPWIEILAKIEGLDAHIQAIKLRDKK